MTISYNQTALVGFLQSFVTLFLCGDENIVLHFDTFNKYANVNLTISNNLFVLSFQAGISSAYQEKPCLNPYDPECPDTAPNKETKQVSCLLIYIIVKCQNFKGSIHFESFIHLTHSLSACYQDLKLS